MNFPILFLDVDGVLNTHEPLCPHVMCGQIHDDKIALLKEVLIETNAKVVLSSAWRYIVHRGEMNLVGINWLFRSHGLPNVVIGVTREDTMIERLPSWDGKQAWSVSNERGMQISDWRTEQKHRGPYAVIDDLDLGIRECDHPFVQTESNIGLTRAHAEQLKMMLKS